MIKDGETDWEVIDFPVWIRYESYDDDWKLGRLLQEKTGVKKEQIPTECKYTVFEVWFKITANNEVKGPYDDKNGDLI